MIPTRSLLAAAAACLPIAALAQAEMALRETAGIALPDGFEANLFAEDLGRVRHIAVAPNGDVYARMREEDGEGYSVVALRDSDGDGVADREERFFEDGGGSSVAVFEDALYVSDTLTVWRIPFAGGNLVPAGEATVVVDGFPRQRAHADKTFAIAPDGSLFVNVGVPSNACQESIRTPGSPGQTPCPELERTGGIWRFDARGDGQKQSGAPYVTGIRNAVALAWNAEAEALYFANHGRDQLHGLFPDLYTVEQNAELPAEEFHVASAGAHYGWPFTYWNPMTGQRIQAPEYGGRPDKVADAADFPVESGRFEDPLTGYPGHWAPNGLHFYQGDQFPERYRGAAFIAWHGSWNRAPLPQGGYNVTVQPMQDGAPAEDWFVFADGFKGAETLASPRDAEHRPMGLAELPDGSLLISDTVEGDIWRVRWVGE